MQITFSRNFAIKKTKEMGDEGECEIKHSFIKMGEISSRLYANENNSIENRR